MTPTAPRPYSLCAVPGPAAEAAHGLHSCSWHCDRPGCIRAQRDELRERVAELQDNGNRLLAVADSAVEHQRNMINAACEPLRKRIAELETDAARYQWLRDGCCDKDTAASRIAQNEYGMHWDAAIDAARKE